MNANQEGLKFLAETIKKEEVVEFDQKLIDRINIKTISEFTKN